ncbi:unnamed protein product [Paramecium sonneborni]|uniref:Uncharacterized protein n=1 Tax=Paramecium sonneborni TaxID=65129 RepID=A0A8S1RI06_9CILI|nr:unnamed protein product [Paramecium sonneborni]
MITQIVQNNQDIYIQFTFQQCMKSQNSKKPNLKIALNKKQVASSIKQEKPPSSKCSQKTTSSNGNTTASSKQLCFKFHDIQSTSNPTIISEGEKKSLDQNQTQQIQLLIQEVLQLQKESKDMDTIISKLIINKKSDISDRANTSITERNTKKFLSIKKLQPNTCDQKYNTPLNFTFCNVDETQQVRVIQAQTMTRSQKGLPDVFQVVPNQRRFFV